MPASQILLRITCAVSAEVRKAWTFPAMLGVLLIGGLAIAALATFGIVQSIRFMDLGRAEDIGDFSISTWPLVALHFGQAVPILLGAWVVGQDAAAGARRTASLAVSSRSMLISAKFAVVVLVTLFAAIVCSLGALAPLLATGDRSGAQIDASRIAWLIFYWILIGLIAAGIAAATNSMVVAVVPLLVWAIGFSDFVVDSVPSFEGVLDQVFKAAYQGGITPSIPQLTGSIAQVLIVIALGAAIFSRRDTN